MSDIIKAARLAQDIGVRLETGLILFDPFVGLDELSVSVRLLESTGLWTEAKSVLSFFKVYKNTPYEKWVRREGLLGEFDPDLLTYEWSFASEDVALIAEECLRWRMCWHSIYSALRHVERTDLSSTYAQEYLRRFRFQDLMFLKEMVNSVGAPSDFSELRAQAAARRTRLLRDLHEHLEHIDRSAADNLLAQEMAEPYGARTWR